MPCSLWIVCSACAAPAAQPDACAAPLSAAIPNSCIVKDGVLWRGSKPTEAGAAALVALGVKSVVNLELLHGDVGTFTQAKVSPAAPLSIGYYRIPEWEPNVKVAPALLDQHVAEFLAIVRTQSKPVYVHCRSGQNRTGVMVAAYRIVEEDMPAEQAIEEMRRYGGVWHVQDAAYLRTVSKARMEPLVRAQLNAVKQDAWLDCGAARCVQR